MKKPLALWTSFVAAFATLSYSLRFTEGKPPKNLLYKWSTVAGNLFQFAIIAAIVYGIAGLGERVRLLALRRPTSWRQAIGIGIGIGIETVIAIETETETIGAGAATGTCMVSTAVPINCVRPL